MNISRESVIAALVTFLTGLVEPITGKEISVDRQLRLWTDVPKPDRPALFIVEHGESVQQGHIGIPSKTVLNVELVFYTDAFSYGATPPAAAMNNLLDTIIGALTPAAGHDQQQTLGGVVYNVWVEGNIAKVPGDIDGDGMATIPLKILVP